MAGDLGFINTVKRELRRMVSRPMYVLGVLIIPAFIAFFMLDFLKEGLPTRVPCAVVDLDRTEMSRSIIQTLDALESAKVVEVCNSYTEAQNAVKRGDIMGFFIIPENFSRDALSFRGPQISLYSNFAYMIPGTFVYKGMLTTATLAKGALVKGLLEGVGMPEQSVKVSLMPIENHVHPLNNPQLNYNIYLSNSFIPCGLALMILIMTAYCIGMEIKHGTSVEWLKGAHNSLFIALLGKLLPYTVLYSVMSVAFSTVMYRYIGFPMHAGVLQMVLTTILFVMATQALGVILCMIIPNLRFALSGASLIGILSFSLAGFSFPAEHMYRGVEIFSWLLPIRYYFLIYVDQFLNGIDLYYSRYYYAALLAFLLVPFLMWKRLKKICLDPVYIA